VLLLLATGRDHDAPQATRLESMKHRESTEEFVKIPNVLAKIFPAGGEMVRRPPRICQAGSKSA